MHQMPPGDAADPLETSLAVALAAARQSRRLIEENAEWDDHAKDAMTLRRVYADLLTVVACVAGVAAVLEQRRELTAILETADTERPSAVRLVR